MLLRATLLATLAVLAAMWGWSIPALDALSGGAPILDARLTGYDFDTARALLDALGEEGRALYLGRQQALDTIFPALLAASLILTGRRLLGARGALGVMLAALIYAGFDYSENATIARMLAAGPEALSPALVAAASRLTVAKFASLAVALALLGLGAVRGLGNLAAR